MSNSKYMLNRHIRARYVCHTDTILSFEAIDKIDLSGIDANVGRSGNPAFNLVGGPGFTGQAGLLQVRNAVDGAGRDVTFVEGDVNGDGTADFQITLMGTHDLTESNFVL